MTKTSNEGNALQAFLADPENMRIFQRERLIMEITQAIYAIMEDTDIGKSELARRLGKSAAFVSQVLDGDRNMTLRTVSDIFTALDRQVHIFDRPLTGDLRPEPVMFLRSDETPSYRWATEEDYELIVCSRKAENQVAA